MRRVLDPQHTFLTQVGVVLQDAAAPGMIVRRAIENRGTDEHVAGCEGLKRRPLFAHGAMVRAARCECQMSHAAGRLTHAPATNGALDPNPVYSAPEANGTKARARLKPD